MGARMVDLLATSRFRISPPSFATPAGPAVLCPCVLGSVPLSVSVCLSVWSVNLLMSPAAAVPVEPSSRPPVCVCGIRRLGTSGLSVRRSCVNQCCLAGI